jgi:hypothetical protein
MLIGIDDYYAPEFHFCQPEGGPQKVSESLGSILFGDRIFTSAFDVRLTIQAFLDDQNTELTVHVGSADQNASKVTSLVLFSSPPLFPVSRCFLVISSQTHKLSPSILPSLSVRAPSSCSSSFPPLQRDLPIPLHIQHPQRRRRLHEQPHQRRLRLPSRLLYPLPLTNHTPHLSRRELVSNAPFRFHHDSSCQTVFPLRRLSRMRGLERGSMMLEA